MSSGDEYSSSSDASTSGRSDDGLGISAVANQLFGDPLENGFVVGPAGAIHLVLGKAHAIEIEVRLLLTGIGNLRLRAGFDQFMSKGAESSGEVGIGGDPASAGAGAVLFGIPAKNILVGVVVAGSHEESIEWRGTWG